MTIQTRRQFLHRGWCMAASLSSLATFAGAAKWASAIEPFPRSGPGPMKLSLAAYSFRQALTQPADSPGAMTLFDVVDYCRHHRVPGVELTSYFFPDGFDEDYLLRLARHCHVQGVSISGGAIRNDFCVNATERPSQLQAVRRWIDAYAVLGAPVIRIFAGSPPEGVSRDEAIERCVEACELACAYAGEKGIFLALENHHGITDTAESMLRVVHGVQSEWFGVNLDSGNFKSADDPYAPLARIAPYAINAQVKVEVWNDGQQVAADLPRIVQLLRDADYGGWVALEYEADEPAAHAIPAYLERLEQLLVTGG